MVDLSKAKAGDTVKFRCGGEAVIENIETTENSNDVRGLGFKGYWDSREDHLWYSLDGTSTHTNKDFPLDITEVIPAPVEFDWKDARWGMGFTCKDGALVFVGNSPVSEEFVVCFSKFASGHSYNPHRKEHLTRAPEHDVMEK